MNTLSRRRIIGTSLSSAAIATLPLKLRAQALPATPALQLDSIGGTRLVSVKSFGAKGDGKTDDSRAINAAINYMRSAKTDVYNQGIGWRLDFPYGVYCVLSTINLTGIQCINTDISGNGSYIVGKCFNKPVIDALISRFLTIRDLNIVGDSLNEPSVGIQIGVTSSTTFADDHMFNNLNITGSFSITCMYNRASETSSFYNMSFWNNNAKGYCLIQDGLNHFDIRSDFQIVNLKKDSDLSFNENVFYNCNFRSAGGCAVWLGDTARLMFLQCYAATTTGNLFTLFCGGNGGNGSSLLSIDCHCETNGLESIFEIDGNTNYAQINGFSYTDTKPFASKSIFTSSPSVSSILIEGASIEIADFNCKTCNLFDNPYKYVYVGDFKSGTLPAGPLLNRIEGRVTIGSNVYVGVWR